MTTFPPVAEIWFAEIVFVLDVIVLFVKVSIVLRPISVSVFIGRVNVPVLIIVPIIGAVSVLLLNVSALFLVTIVSVIDGNVNVFPETEIVDIIGVESVLLLNVSLVVHPTIVSVEVGNVKIPVLRIVPIVGEMSVLFDNVSVPIRVAKPLVILVDGTQFAPVVDVDCRTYPEFAGPVEFMITFPPVALI